MNITNRIVSLLLAVTIVVTYIPSVALGASNQDLIWEYFKNQGFSDAAVAGIMGNIEAESSYLPNNLEGLSNSKSGWSDSQFTTAVDNGTISRAEFISSSRFGVCSSGTQNGTEYGYGLAQWTYITRKAGLYDFAKKRNVSIANLTMQLDYMMTEINGNSSLKNYLMTASNVSDACVYFHNVYEGSADNAAQIAGRVSKAENVYAKYHNDNLGDKIQISGNNAPSSLSVGQAYSIYGSILSGKTLTSVTVGVFDKETGGTLKTGVANISPNSTYFNISSVDAKVEFNKLAAGTYYYRISATNSAGTTETRNTKFTVGSGRNPNQEPVNTDTSIKISNANKPGTIKEGGVFSIQGTITSNYELVEVVVGCYYNLNPVSGAYVKVNPYSTRFDIHSVDRDIKFNILKPGNYVYIVRALNNAGVETTLLEHPFIVESKTVDYSISLSGETKPTSLDVGDVFILKGTISSPATLTSVTVGVFDQESGGTMKTGRTVSPNSTSYNIANIDAYVEFNKLPAGTYYYRITATNAGGTKSLLNHKFTVGSQQPVIAKPSNVKVTTDKSTYSLGETVTITPSATGATQYSYRVCYETYGDDTTEVFQYGFTGSRTFVPDKEGTYIVRISAINDGGYTDGECSFVVTKPQANTYTIVYDANGGTGAPAAQTKEAGVALTLQSKTPERNYNLTYDFNLDEDSRLWPHPPIAATFTGWNTKQDGTGTSYSAGSSYTSDASVTLYAQWAPSKVDKLYTLNTTNAGKVFDGWYTALQGGMKVNDGLSISGDMTIYARWRVASDPIAVDQEGVHFEQQTIYFQDQFTDVPPEQWFTKSVASAFELGLMKGNSATTFNPYGDVTIAEAITMAARIHSIYMTGSENFVQSGKWYQVYLDYAYQNGVISKAYHNCDVSQKATRAQFAEIFANSLPDEGLYPMNSIGENAIPDVKSTDIYAPYVYKLYRAGILTGGDARGTFSPTTYITRAEAAAIVSRMAESNNRVAFSLN